MHIAKYFVRRVIGRMLCISAPEKVNREKVGVPADIWGVGVLAFIL